MDNGDPVGPCNVKTLLGEKRPAQIKATNTSTVFFGNQKIDGQDVAKLVWDGRSTCKRVSLPVKYENGEPVPDFDLLQKVNEINRWRAENPNVTQIEVNSKLAELQGENVTFDPEKKEFVCTNTGFFLSFEAYASDTDGLDLSKSEGYLVKLPRMEGKRVSDWYSNLVQYDKENPGKSEKPSNPGYSGGKPGRMYYGNVYIPITDATQGFYMSNKQYRPKQEFYNPSKMEELNRQQTAAVKQST